MQLFNNIADIRLIAVFLQAFVDDIYSVIVVAIIIYSGNSQTRFKFNKYLAAHDLKFLNRLQKIAPRNVFFDGWTPFKDIWLKIASCSVGVALRSDNPGNEYVVTS